MSNDQTIRVCNNYLKIEDTGDNTANNCIGILKSNLNTIKIQSNNLDRK